MSKTFVRILLISLLCKSGLGKPRVNQGREIDIEDAPYMVYIQVRLTETTGLACDGSILSEWFVLTAGHCVTDESNMDVPNPPLHDPSAFSIMAGTSDSTDPNGELFSVSKVFYRDYSSENDMGILQLSSNMMLDGITKRATTLVSNTNYKPKIGTKVYVDGWGKNPQDTSHLLRANIHTISDRDCNKGPVIGQDRTYQIWTLGRRGAGPCQGDSGGPLLRSSDGAQIGLVSYVPLNCAQPVQTRSIFTAIAPNLNWIRGVMNGDDDDSNEVETTTKRTKPATTKPPRNPANIFGIPLRESFPYAVKGGV